VFLQIKLGNAFQQAVTRQHHWTQLKILLLPKKHVTRSSLEIAWKLLRSATI